MLRLSITLSILLSMLASGLATERIEMTLDGNWSYQKVKELDTPPQTGVWQPTIVPGTLRGYNYERAWFRRTFTMPASMQGKRIKIHFDGVKYNSRVWINGQHVGGVFNGYDAFDLDVTDAIRFDQPNEIAVGLHDWTGVFSEGRFDFSELPSWQRPRRYVTDKVIAPIGGYYDHYGIWGDVTLTAQDAVYIKNVFIKPSVRNQELVVEYELANESTDAVEVQINAIVEEGQHEVLRLGTEKLTIPAGQTRSITLTQPWTDARYWSPEDPHLYHLRTELSTGDALRTRFGFREFWIEEHRYILNGSKINLLGTSWWPPTEPMTAEQVREKWQALQQAGIVVFRTHTQPWRRVHYDVADELGLLMIIEGPMWHDPYCICYDDPRYWKNYADSIHAMIEREKNRPSVIMWSMDNEAYSSADKTKLAVAGLAKVGRMAKQWDPTRPIYFESDGDPEGVADAIGMHYVHEYPKYTCWPNEAYWLDKPFSPHTWSGFLTEPYVWKKDKPLYIGEFLWVPSGTPAPHTVFFGDEAYRDLDQYEKLGKAEAWKMQVLAFRHQEAGGMCPWTVGENQLDESNPLYRAHQTAYQPLAAYCLDYDKRFYSNEKVNRRVEIFNESMDAQSLGFEWTLKQGEKTLASDRKTVTVEAGEKQMLTVKLPMPEVDSRTPLAWQVTLSHSGTRVFDETHDYAVFPKLRLPQTQSTLGLYDPKGDTAKLLSESKIEVVDIHSIQSIAPEVDVLVIGAGSLDQAEKTAPVVGRVNPKRGALMDFVGRGGRVLVLRQDVYPEGLFDLEPTPQTSTMTFPQRPSHPALDGVEADDLKFWRGDHLVADHELPRPSTGSAISVVVSGSDTGIAHAPLLDRPLGRGSIVHCQLKLIEKARSEPAAGEILGNLLRYLDHYKPTERKTLVLGSDADYRESLSNLGLRFVAPTNTDGIDLGGYSLLILHGELPNNQPLARQIGEFVQRGGNLLVHRPNAQTMGLVRQASGIELVMQPFAGAVSQAESDHPLSEVFTREDLYWTIKQPGESWTRQPPSRDMVDGVFGSSFDTAKATAHEIESWKTVGQFVHSVESGIMFATVGSASGELEFPESGKYAVGIRAQGTVCEGVYPIAEISIDGKPFGSVQLDSEDWKDYGIVGHVEKGRHPVVVSFVNDGAAPPDEDRNLVIDKVLVARDQRADDTIFLTAPAAVVTQDIGEGRIVFDRIRWDTETDNGRKASRHVCSLLTALGGDFTPRSAITLECEQMTPGEGISWYSADGSTAYMGSNGYIATGIEVARAGVYRGDLVAAGDASEGIGPLVEIHLDGSKIGEVQLTTEGWRSYPLQVELPSGKHDLALKFVNDYSSPSGDRNLRLDKLVLYNNTSEVAADR
ncbi:carbohydrate-binding domain-containing protein [Novipirellula artificiosorum]|uniref:Beta-galactosidase n=1 Tax=Novipirellula artificiosorum TaxID=2528016 RepID=A0A5C6DLR1_9BACT|nr:carbohydrate-binding domain-containing protein [Novipirellula artificiosorum]TWU35866.1 Beta-galactosidase [Novipirellula artificiosorum]